MKARIQGVTSQMHTFKFLFGLILCEMILRHTSQTLQQPKLSSVEGREVAMLTVKTLQHLWSDDNFDLFWQKVEKMRYQLDIVEPHLARKQNVPRQCEQGSAPAEFAESPKDEHRHADVFEALDLAVTSICNRFDQKGFKTFSNVEQLLFKACKGQHFEEELDLVCNFFYNDFDKDDLVAELSTFHKLYQSAVPIPSVSSIKTALLTLSNNQQKLLSSVCTLFQILPCTADNSMFTREDSDNTV